MKKKNGFTLIELLVTIGILVIMSAIIATNIVSILRATEDNDEVAIKKEVEKAACVYVDSSLNTGNCNSKNKVQCNITLSTLISSGLIDDSYNDKASKTVTVKWVSGEKICTYNG